MFRWSAEKCIFRYLCGSISVRSSRLERHRDWRNPFYSSIERHVDVKTSSRTCVRNMSSHRFKDPKTFLAVAVLLF
jgi:hypothetical protein